ncbi:MAG TPA: PPC domain-containing DNA-binding protein, partial [Myxococcales bacterium]|nr:PPC domain-containing DNA-binding protein [Myxococcales bacterium]
MKSKVIKRIGERTFVLVMDSGDEVVSALTQFARSQGLAGSHFTAIGALHDVALGFFDWQTKDYRRIELNEQVEVLSLLGDVALDDGEPRVHAHIVVGRRDGTAHGGHLLEAHVRPTLEVVLIETPALLRR